MTDAGSEFQTDGAAHRKERFAKSVRANGWMNSGVAVDRSVRALTRRLNGVAENAGVENAEAGYFDRRIEQIMLLC